MQSVKSTDFFGYLNLRNFKSKNYNYNLVNLFKKLNIEAKIYTLVFRLFCRTDGHNFTNKWKDYHETFPWCVKVQDTIDL